MRPFLAICSLVLLVGFPQPALGALAPVENADPETRASLPPLTITVTVTLTLASGSDTGGLDGATVTFTGTFANGTLYVDDGGGFPAAIAATHSLTVSGASVGANNGTFSDPDGFTYNYDPLGDEGFWIDNLTSFDFYTVSLPVGGAFVFGLVLGLPTVEPGIGDGVATSHFALTLSASTIEHAGSTYTLTLSGSGVDPTGGPTDVTGGTIEIIKDTVPDAAQDFSFTTTGGLSPATFDLDDDADGTLSNTQTFSDVAPGTYTVTETAVAGYSTALSCVDPDGGTTTAGATATIDLDAGETVTCTFTNTELGTIEIIKDTVPDDAQDFSFTTTGGLSPATFDLDDDADGTLSNTQAFTDVAPGSYTVTETAVAGFATSLACVDPDGGSSTAGATAMIDLDAGETVTCTFTNTVVAPTDVTTDKDSILRPGARDRNEGANPLLHLGESRRLVVGFDLSAVNLSGLTSATLVLTINDDNDPGQWGPSGRTVDAHRLLEAFVEGNGKAFGLPNPDKTRGTGSGVTWKCGIDTAIENQKADCVNPAWNGGNFEATASDQFLMTNGATGEATWDVTSDVIAGFDSWLIKKTSGNGNARFYAKEHPDVVSSPDLAPRLVLDFGAASPRVEAGGGGQEMLELEVPSEYVLEPNYPNPFNPETTIRFGVPEAAYVRLVVYDVLGRQVRVLVEGTRASGRHEVVFEASNLPSGTYLVRLETPQGSFVQTMQLVK